MTEQEKQYNQPTQDFDEIDKLSHQLEVVQKLHAESLRELQETEGKLLDITCFERITGRG